MSLFQNISISLSESTYLLILGIFLILIYTIFIYRTTLPPISNLMKWTLISIRTVALFLILFLLFDPIIKISSTQIIEPETLIFIDDSRSISEFSDKAEIQKNKDLLNELDQNLEGKKRFILFGNSVKEFSDPNFDSISYNQTSTSFETILKEVKKIKDISSILVLSDGIYNVGSNPEIELINQPNPIFTVGIGDTTTYSDVKVGQIINNNFVYTNRETEIEIILKHENLNGKKAIVELFDNNSLIETQSVKLSETGINRVRFPFITDKEGKHNLQVKTTLNSQEKNNSNNSKSTLINVLASKKKIVIISGSPSPDMTAIIGSIKNNENYEVNKIIEVNNGKFYSGTKNLKIIEESDIIFLIGFPNQHSDENFINEVSNIIVTQNKPLFIAFSNSIDLERAEKLPSIFPFKISNYSERFFDDQITSNINFSGILGDDDNSKNAWENLPPISLNLTRIIPNSSANVLMFDKSTKSIPIIFTNEINRQKSIVVNAANIWRWKLKTSQKEYLLFDNFILNSIKWLSIEQSDKYFTIKSNKENYRMGETIIFNANLYSDTFEPINNEKIIVELAQGESIQKITLASIGNGLYESELNLQSPGIYEYSAKLENNSRNLPVIKGNINIEPIELELIDGKMNTRFLQKISNETNGDFFLLNNTNDLVENLNEISNNKIYNKNIDNELRLSNLELILLLIVLLFSIEWIIRKIFRMI
ncbi:MAG: hypothetical protein H6611_02625 [Ignavibacteriales bacterium]|nr:hypothetical protein [Ignavibacteriales bacterium]